MSKVLNKAEKLIGKMCYEGARNKNAAGKYLNRYERMLQSKALSAQKEENRERSWN